MTANADLTVGNDLTVNAGAALTNSGKTITVTGTVTVESDGTGTGSFIQGSSGFSASVKRYVTQTDFHYISSPVSSQPISPEFISTGSNPLPTTIDFYKFDEPNNLWRNIKDSNGDLNVGFETDFEVNRGYAVAYSDNNYTKTFTGTLNYSNQSHTLDRTTSTGNEGWNLVGNPYPASIAVNTNADASNNLLSDNSSSLHSSYIGVYLWGGSDYSTINQASAAAYLSPGQGFFVNAASNGASFLVNTAIQKHNNATFYKNVNQPARFTIGITGPAGDVNETMIAFMEGASKGKDPGYDSRKYKANANLALYSYLVNNDGGHYIIQTLPPTSGTQVVQLGLDVWQSGNYEFGSVQTENMLGQTVYLEDKQTYSFINLNNNPTYTFTIAQPGIISNRFALHFGGIITGNTELDQLATTVSIFSSGDEVAIQNIGGDQINGTVEIFNMTGQLLFSESVTVNGYTSKRINPGISSGFYLVRLKSEQLNIAHRIILH